MTAHEVLTSMFWLVAIAYGLYLGWFATVTVRSSHRSSGGSRKPARRTRRNQGPRSEQEERRSPTS